MLEDPKFLVLVFACFDKQLMGLCFRARLKAEALLERRRREQDRKDQERQEQAAISNGPDKEEGQGNPTRPRVPVPPRQTYRDTSRDVSEEFYEAADRPRTAPAPRQRSHGPTASAEQHTHHQPVQAPNAGQRRKEDVGRREGATSASNTARAAAGQYQASADVSPQPPLKDLVSAVPNKKNKYGSLSFMQLDIGFFRGISSF